MSENDEAAFCLLLSVEVVVLVESMIWRDRHLMKMCSEIWCAMKNLVCNEEFGTNYASAEA